MRAENDSNWFKVSEAELVEELGEFLKCSSIYPANNIRVRSAYDGLRAALTKVKESRGARMFITLPPRKGGSPLTLPLRRMRLASKPASTDTDAPSVTTFGLAGDATAASK